MTRDVIGLRVEDVEFGRRGVYTDVVWPPGRGLELGCLGIVATMWRRC